MNKIFTLASEIKSVKSDDDGFITIVGMASTNDSDRVGDIIHPDAWTKSGGLEGFNKNPIILFNHDYRAPIGKVTEISVVEKGLRVVAKISKSVGQVAKLIEQGILKTFSVGFRIREADYIKETGGLSITDAELHEISVVSIPCNAAATFDQLKSYSESEFDAYRKGLQMPTQEGNKEGIPSSKENKSMNEEEIKKLLEAAAAKAAKDAKDAAKMAIAEAEAERIAEAKRKADEEARIKSAEEAAVKAGASGAEKLVEEVKKAFETKEAANEERIKNLEAALRDRTEDVLKLRESKRVFVTGNGSREEVLKQVEGDLRDAYVLNAIKFGKGGFEGDYAKSIIEKATNAMSSVGAPSVSGVEIFENTVSTSIERDIQNGLILAPLFREIVMNTATMTLPIMPDAGYAEFVSTKTYENTGANPPEGSLSERGDTVGSPYGGVDLGEKILSTKKLMSVSFLANETSEDTILAILPLINETMIRSHQRSVEHAFLLGGHSQGSLTGGFDGLCEMARDLSLEATSGTAYASDKLTAANLMTLRRNMGKYGVRPNDVVYIVSQKGYFDLLEDPEFQDANLVGNAAVKLTGEIGQLYGSKVLLCDEFPAPAVTKLYAMAVNTRNYLVPRIRGVTLESDYRARLQHRELIATQRLGFEDLIETGTAVATRKYNGS